MKRNPKESEFAELALQQLARERRDVRDAIATFAFCFDTREPWRTALLACFNAGTVSLDERLLVRLLKAAPESLVTHMALLGEAAMFPPSVFGHLAEFVFTRMRPDADTLCSFLSSVTIFVMRNPRQVSKYHARVLAFSRSRNKDIRLQALETLGAMGLRKTKTLLNRALHLAGSDDRWECRKALRCLFFALWTKKRRRALSAGERTRIQAIARKLMTSDDGEVRHEAKNLLKDLATSTP